MSTPEMCVIHNPASGRGRGQRRLERLRTGLGPRAEFWPTTGPGHAEELAVQAVQSGFSIVAAAGGDGTVHEVANGLLRAGRPETTLAVFPIGSANDYAQSLGVGPDWWRHPSPSLGPRPVDVGLARAGSRARYFVNGLGLGLTAVGNVESRRIHGLPSPVRYGLALLKVLCFHYDQPLLNVTLDGHERRTPTLTLSVSLGRREGNFVVAPDARLDDGLFDYLHVGPVPRRAALPLVPGLFAGRFAPVHPSIWVGCCRHVHVRSTEALVVHVDGEFFCLAEDGVCDLEVTLLPGALRVLADLPRL